MENQPKFISYQTHIVRADKNEASETYFDNGYNLIVFGTTENGELWEKIYATGYSS